MTRILALIRPFRLEQVKAAIAAQNISGLNVTDVRVAGLAGGSSRLGGAASSFIPMPIRCRLEVVVEDESVEAVCESIVFNARTGEPGDGVVILQKIEDAIRIRTGERGDTAL